VVTFGGAYAVLAYVAQAAVDTYGWLEPGEMLDGLGMAETTPGPLIMVTQFVGFLAAYRDPGALGPWTAAVCGAVLTVWVTFVPCFLWIFLGAPWVEVLRGNRALSGALAAITASVVGVIANLAVWFGLHVLFRDVRVVHAFGATLDVPVLASVDVAGAALFAGAAWALLRAGQGTMTVLAATALAGVVLWGAGLASV
jgi:chromate transporter